MVNAGRILILTKGLWNSQINYEQLDLVTYNGFAYLARKASVDVNPSQDTLMEYWQPFGKAAEIATTSDPGLVMPDGDTIKIESSGLIYVDMDASDIDYDNTQTGITASTVQAAIDTAVVNAQLALNGIAPIEATSTASQAHALGSFFFYNGNLYVTTLAFALGAMIIPGTNCEQTTVGDVLKTLNEKAYQTDDATETDLASDDILPFYDTSATAKKKMTVQKFGEQLISNRNLLDNPWFTVNQRGQSNYTSAGYTVDRWNLLVTATVSVTDDGLNISGSSEFYFVQYLENDISTRLLGKTITMSALVGGVIYKTTAQIPSSFPASESNITFVNIGALTLALQINATRIFVMLWGSGTLNSIRAVKLELGSVSTLALDTAPNYQQELAKCQRYFNRVKQNASISQFGIALPMSTDIIKYVYQFPVEMRTIPTVTPSDTLDFYYATNSDTASMTNNPTTVNRQGGTTRDVGIGFIKIGAFTVGTVYAVAGKGYFDLSADL